MSLYDITGSPLLTGASASLNLPANAATLDAWSRVAEAVLGFQAPALTDPDKVTLATDAVALQVSYSYNLGWERFGLSSETRGRRSMSYKDVLVNPAAQILADEALGCEVVAARIDTLTSVRSTALYDAMYGGDPMLYFV